MSSLRGVDRFEELWARRTTIDIAGEAVDLLSIEDLVRAKKTQRDKDWPMIRRLMERSYFEGSGAPTDDLVRFWLYELRTPELLVEVVAAHPEAARAAAARVRLSKPPCCVVRMMWPRYWSRKSARNAARTGSIGNRSNGNWRNCA